MCINSIIYVSIYVQGSVTVTVSLFKSLCVTWHKDAANQETYPHLI